MLGGLAKANTWVTKLGGPKISSVPPLDTLRGLDQSQFMGHTT
jgi:hypothetical protein